MVRSFTTTAGCALIALVGAFSLTAQAQTRTVDSGVYSAAQAGRGQKLYAAQCAACHGEQLQGLVGPMLTGNGFNTNWAGKSLADLTDKIENTMPVQAPKSLSRAQAIDIVSYILQTGKRQAGNAELAAANLAGVTFPGAARPTGGATAGGLQIDMTANLAQYMRAVTFPNANIIFNLQVKEPIKERPNPPVPFDYLYWGYNQYWGWQAVDQAAMALIETTPLLLLPRRCENGLQAPIEQADYKQWVQDLVNFGKEALKTSQSRNYEGMVALAEKLDATCLNCHRKYRDAASEGKSAGTDRCRVR